MFLHYFCVSLTAHTKFVIVALVLMCINSVVQSSLNIWISRHKSIPNPDGQTALAALKGMRIKLNISQCVHKAETNCLIWDFYALTPPAFAQNVLRISYRCLLRSAPYCHRVTVCVAVQVPGIDGVSFGGN